MPLRLVADALSVGGDGMRGDVTALLRGLDDELTRLNEALAAAFDGAPWPAPAQSPTELLHQERHALELAVLSGQLTDGALEQLTEVYEQVAADPEHLVAAMGALAGFAGLAGQDPADPGGREPPAHRVGVNRRRRNEFVTTNTELTAIAAPAISGLSRPEAASGIAATL